VTENEESEKIRPDGSLGRENPLAEESFTCTSRKVRRRGKDATCAKKGMRRERKKERGRCTGGGSTTKGRKQKGEKKASEDQETRERASQTAEAKKGGKKEKESVVPCS